MRNPFNLPPFVGPKIDHVKQAMQNERICGDGQFNQKCHTWLQAKMGCTRALLTTSGSHTLKMSTLHHGIQSDDEVIHKKGTNRMQFHRGRLQSLADAGDSLLPFIPAECKHKAPMFYGLRPKDFDFIRNKVKEFFGK